MPGTRKLGRTTDHRKAMLRGMVTYLLENGKVETTVTRAKEVRAMAEKMITVAKDNTLHAKRQAFAYITKDTVVKKLFDEIAPQYAGVNGGYTRIIKTGTRRGENVHHRACKERGCRSCEEARPPRRQKNGESRAQGGNKGCAESGSSRRGEGRAQGGSRSRSARGGCTRSQGRSACGSRRSKGGISRRYAQAMRRSATITNKSRPCAQNPVHRGGFLDIRC